jgi:hypothetical protein
MTPPFKLMRPVRNFVWTPRTTDTRIFGWFVRLGWFIAVNAAATDAEADTEPGTRLLPGSPGTGHAMARPAFMFGCRPYLAAGLR